MYNKYIVIFIYVITYIQFACCVIQTLSKEEVLELKIHIILVFIVKMIFVFMRNVNIRRVMWIFQTKMETEQDILL